MMLRFAAARLARLPGTTVTTKALNSSIYKRNVTSAQKRALTKEQVSGGEKGTASTTSVKPVETVKSGDGGGATSSGSSGGVGGGKGGGSPSPLPIVALLGVAAGGAYYMDLIPGLNKKENKEAVTVTEMADPAPVKKAAPAPVKKAEAKKTEQPKKVTKAPPKNPETKEVQKSVVKETGTAKKKEASQPHRVLNIHVPPKNGRVQKPVPPTQHATDGNRVSNADFRKVYLQDTVVLNGKRKSTTTASPPTAAMANDALKELEPSVGTSVVDETMAKEQARMRASADETLNDLESLTASQLRVRVVQLVSEISDRTKWEAVRLKEFLTMKEREVGEQYMETMQKQRLQYEDLLARRLREQEFELVAKANEELKAKEESIERVVNAVTETKDAEHEAALKMVSDSLQQEISAKYEKEMGERMAMAKEEFTKDLESHVATLEELSERLRQNEQNLEISRNFESGSQRAHRVSAAALALAEKMETSKGATEEFISLKAAAVENGVIASALSSIPNSVKSGVLTLPELQATFDGVLNVGRQAAYVPIGRSGLEGQFAGMIFSALTVPPSPDALPPSDVTPSESKLSDYTLARAKRHVQLGELQEAVDELDKLKGQPAFVLGDWKQTAMDRIAVDKALKVIKMECALMNKNMGGS